MKVRPRLSGFCNPSLPRTEAYDPHQRCRGCDCRAPGCPCNPQETPVTTTETRLEALAPGACSACGTREEVCDASDAGCCPECSQASYDTHATTTEPAGADTPEDAVAWARSAADALNTALAGYNPDDWRDAVRLLRDLRRATSLLNTLDASLVHWLYLHGEHGIHLRVEGVAGDVSIGRGRSKERWAGVEAAQDYVERRIIENEGENPDPRQVVEWVLEVVPAGKCRVTPLREHGLEVDDYRTSEPGSLNVSLPTG